MAYKPFFYWPILEFWSVPFLSTALRLIHLLLGQPHPVLSIRTYSRRLSLSLPLPPQTLPSFLPFSPYNNNYNLQLPPFLSFLPPYKYNYNYNYNSNLHLPPFLPSFLPSFLPLLVRTAEPAILLHHSVGEGVMSWTPIGL